MKTTLSLTLLAAALACTLAACGRKPASTQPAASITRAQFGDSDPHEGVSFAARYPVHGIDISRYQTGIDWAAAQAGGVNFAFMKATEGGDIADAMFPSHWRGARAAGVARGAYHFYYHCRSAAEQADWFIAHVPRRTGDLPPVLDMEWTPTSPTCRDKRAPSVIRRDATEFIARLTAAYGTVPILYTTTDFFADNDLGRLRGVEFWLRSVAAHPSQRYQGQGWTFWQYTATGRAAGIPGNVDLNAFAGSPKAWATWLAERAQR